MNKEQIEQLVDYEWDKFTRRYPVITDNNIVSKILFLFKKDNTAKLVFENGFYQGYLAATKDTPK